MILLDECLPRVGMEKMIDLDSLKLPSFDDVLARLDYLKTVKSDLVTYYKSDEYVWARVGNGAGDEGTLLAVPHTREVLVYGYDHESSLNFYSKDNYQVKQKTFQGLPDSLNNIIQSRTLDWSFAPGFVYATVAFWLINNTWHVSQDYSQSINWEQERSSIKYVLNLVLTKTL